MGSTVQIDMGSFEFNPNMAPEVETVNLVDVGAGDNGQSAYSFTITYSDDLALAIASIDTADVSVIGPSGALVVLSAVPETSSNGTPRTVTYTVEPPGGTWDHSDNGVYTINLVMNQVGDDGAPQLFVAAGQIGSFEVNLPLPVDFGDAPDVGCGYRPGELQHAVYRQWPEPHDRHRPADGGQRRCGQRCAAERGGEGGRCEWGADRTMKTASPIQRPI